MCRLQLVFQEYNNNNYSNNSSNNKNCYNFKSNHKVKSCRAVLL